MPSMIVYGTPSRMDRGLPCLNLQRVTSQQRSFTLRGSSIQGSSCAGYRALQVHVSEQASASAQPPGGLLCRDLGARIHLAQMREAAGIEGHRSTGVTLL